MFHGRVMPLSRRLREGCAAAVLVLCLGPATPVHATDKPRIASLNVCTDQLLLTLADPEQIVGLSPYSRDPVRSWAAAGAAHYPSLSGEAEDVLVLKPDLVVAGRFTKRATRELLKAEGFRVEEFDAARSLDDTKRQIVRMGEITGHPDRAAAAVARIDAAVAQAREAVARKPMRVLSVERRGWVSGGDSLTSSLLATVGLSNAASQLGYKSGGFASLEAIIDLKPDLLLLSDKGDFAEDQGTALLLHPALEQLYPPDKRIVIPEQLTVCGGPMLADALTTLVRELERVEH
jgi:iron complex transport system substrate-binding protein